MTITISKTDVFGIPITSKTTSNCFCFMIVCLIYTELFESLSFCYLFLDKHGCCTQQTKYKPVWFCIICAIIQTFTETIWRNWKRLGLCV